MLVGYARVSTQDQQTALQTDALRAAGCERIFVETASGAKRERQELVLALTSLSTGDILVVWKLDRLARSLKHLIQIVEDLERRGVGFRSLTEAIDTTSAGGRLIFHIFASLAEFERQLIQDRTLAGLAAARLRGRAGGRSRLPMAIDWNEVERLIQDRAATSRDIALESGVSLPTFYRRLREFRRIRSLDVVSRASR